MAWQEVKGAFVALMAPIKNELRRSRAATAYEAVFEMSFMDLITRFAALDGTITASEGKVYLDVFGVLHPKRHAGLAAENGATLLKGHFQQYSDRFQRPFPTPLLLTMAQQAGETYANMLKEVMYKVALQVALADGPLSSAEHTELETLRGASGTTAKPPDSATGVAEPNADATAAMPGKADQIAAVEPDRRFQHPVKDPQFASATGIVTIDILKERTKKLVELLDPMLKVELRKTRQSSVARDLVEQDIRAIIIRVGFAGGTISEYAAHLYLEVFKCLHPRTYSGWTVDSTRGVLQKILGKNRDIYLGVLRRPYTLEVVERLDAAHGTSINSSWGGALAVADGDKSPVLLPPARYLRLGASGLLR